MTHPQKNSSLLMVVHCNNRYDKINSEVLAMVAKLVYAQDLKSCDRQSGRVGPIPTHGTEFIVMV